MKNELAVINEQSRLVAEMLAMAAKGRPADPARLEQLLARVIARVGRADQVVRRLNRFAHSLEAGAPATNACACLELMTAMFTRLAGFKDITVKSESPSEIMVGLSALDCQHLTWQGMLRFLESARAGGEVLVKLSPGRPGATLSLSGKQDTPLPREGWEEWEPFGVRAEVAEGALILHLPPTA